MPRTTETLALAILALAGGCQPASPPLGDFEIELELPPPPGSNSPEPPAAALRPWRVWINQEQPRQRKNPAWQPYAARQSATLELAADGRWRCLITPTQLFAKFDEPRSLRSWSATRHVRCSPDGWKTYSETTVHCSFTASGELTRCAPPAAVHLADVVGGEPRSTVVVLEPLGGYRRELPARAM